MSLHLQFKYWKTLLMINRANLGDFLSFQICVVGDRSVNRPLKTSLAQMKDWSSVNVDRSRIQGWQDSPAKHWLSPLCDVAVACIECLLCLQALSSRLKMGCTYTVHQTMKMLQFVKPARGEKILLFPVMNKSHTYYECYVTKPYSMLKLLSTRIVRISKRFCYGHMADIVEHTNTCKDE